MPSHGPGAPRANGRISPTVARASIPAVTAVSPMCPNTVSALAPYKRGGAVSVSATRAAGATRDSARPLGLLGAASGGG
jgi:hypothetical protein